MNICQVVLSEGWGGAETVVYKLAKHLTDKGQKVSIVLNQEMLRYYANLSNVELFNIGTVLHPIPLAKSILSPRTRQRERHAPHNRLLVPAYSYTKESLACVYHKRVRKQVLRFLSDRNIDVVHAHLEQSIDLTSLLSDAKIPLIATLHGEYDLRGMSHTHAVMRPLLAWRRRRFKRALAKMDKLTHVSQFFMSDAFKHWGENLRDRSVVIPNAIDVSEVQSCLKSGWKLKGGFNLLFPGGAKSMKGGDLVARAFVKIAQQAPDVHLYVALEVPQGHVLRKMVSDNGLEERVTFVGALSAPDYRSLLNCVDVLVMPSKQESFGIVYVEAMALGKPVVATTVGGIPEVVKDRRNGILVEPDSDQVAEAILYLYRNKSVCEELSRNNSHDVARFDWTSVVDQYLEVYAQLSGKA